MASSELSIAEDGEIDMQEQIVTDSTPPKIDQNAVLEHVIVEPVCDVVVTKLELEESESEGVVDPEPKRKRRKKRRYRYQTQDLIRERSPQPQDQTILDSQEGYINQISNDQGAHDTMSAPQDENAVDRNSGSPAKQQNDLPLVTIINGVRTVHCNICKKQMSESRLANHIRLLHVEKGPEEESPDSKRKEFKCEYCGKSYALKYTYDQHIKTHTEGRPKCPECGSTFASAFSLFRHRAKVHNVEHNYTTYNCDQCDKSFFSMSELALHKNRHSDVKEHKCPKCDKAFAVKGNLRIHMRTHAQEKLYRCDICDSSFSHPYSLVSHRRIHTNEYPYSCEVCGNRYRSKHQVTSHMIVHTDERPFKCEECSKTFRSRTAFKMHQDHHKGIKRFTCKFCDRKFQCHANKLKHERRHIGEKKHKCEHCDKAFIEKQELKNHLKVHSKFVGASAKSGSAKKKS